MRNKNPFCVPCICCAAIVAAALNVLPVRAAETKIDPKFLDACVGQYEMAEARFTFRRQGNELTCQVPREGLFQLETKPDKSFIVVQSPDISFKFLADAKGKITHVVFHKAGEAFKIPKTSDQPPQPRMPDTSKIAPRDSQAGPKLLDLSGKYNSRLDEFWQPDGTPEILKQNHLGAMPCGIQRLGATDFDVRGVIQLCSTKVGAGDGGLPKEVKGIRVGQKCRRLHFLQGTQWRVADGTRIGSYVLHYQGGAQAELPVIYGQQVRDWWASGSEDYEAKAARVAWKGSNAASQSQNISLRVFDSACSNPHSEQQIQSVDFVSAMTDSAPFLIAITLE